MATNSISGLSKPILKAVRPMRPKPLMATRILVPASLTGLVSLILVFGLSFFFTIGADHTSHVLGVVSAVIVAIGLAAVVTGAVGVVGAIGIGTFLIFFHEPPFNFRGNLGFLCAPSYERILFD